MLSVIICSIDDARCARVQSMYTKALAPIEHEIIRISDARSMCEGYNRGVRQSRGERLIFSHDDIEILCDDFAARLNRHLDRFDLIGVCGTDRVERAGWSHAGPPHIFGQIAYVMPRGWRVAIFGVHAPVVEQIQAIDGLFMATHRQVAEKLGFDEENFDGFHLYDVDFSFRAHLAGCRVAVMNDIPIIHDSSGKEDASWHRAAAAFMRKHAAHVRPPAHAVEYQYTAVNVWSRDHMRAVMCPRWLREA